MGYFLIAMLVVSSYVDSSSSQSSSHVSNTDNEPWKISTLPENIEPIRYDLNITPNFYFNDSHFDGHVVIHMKVLNQTNTIIVHSKQLQIITWRVLDSTYSVIENTTYFPYEENDYLVFQTVNPLPAKVNLELSFIGNITTIMDQPVILSGLYKVPYVNNLSGKQSWLLVTDFRPGGSRFAFPNFDESWFKAKFNMTIRHRKGFTALSNMPFKKNQYDDTSSWHETTFKLSPRMNSHLVCFTISEFSFKNTTIKETEYRVWARPDRLNEVDYALNVTTAIQQYLHQELGKPYLLEKLDQFAVPGDIVFDKSEKWGLATYSESRLLFSVTKEIDDTKEEALKSIARTLVYSYFERLSVSRLRNHVWLKEALTTFYAAQAVRAIDPVLFHKELYYGKEQALYVDGTNETQALASSSDSPSVEEPEFDPTFVRKEKGAAILRMIESFVGADTFSRAIITFLKDSTNRSVVTRHLSNALQQEVGESLKIKNIMSTWVFERGIPVITVELLPGNVINATQKQFEAYSWVDPNSTLANIMNKWFVPLSYRTKPGNHGLVWMNKTDVVFDVPLNSSNDWIEFNCERSGYYRVNYDTNLWNRIVKQLNEDHTVFSEITRSTLISDAENLAKAQLLGFDTFLNLTKYASKERDLIPWLHISDGFYEINGGLFHTTTYSRVQSYVLKLTSKLMDEFIAKDEEVSYTEKQLSRTIMSLSCAAGHKGCIEIWTGAFNVWIQNKTHVVAEKSRREVYCNAMANSVVESDWNTTFERYILATSTDEKEEFLYILCCSRNFTILEWLLDLSIRPNKTNVDALVTLHIMLNVVRNPSTEGLVWNWFKRNYEKIDQVYHHGVAAYFIFAAVEEFKTQAQYQELLDFYKAYTVVPKPIKDKMKNRIDRNIHWMDRNFNTIANWLEQEASAK